MDGWMDRWIDGDIDIDIDIDKDTYIYIYSHKITMKSP